MLEKEKDVVETDESSASETGVEEQVEDTTAVTPEQEATETQPTPEQSQAPIEAVDEMGVPYKNRAAEWQRKFQEVANEDTIERAVNKALQQHQAQAPKEREHTISELEKFAMDSPEHRPWVEEQKALIIQKSVAKITDDRIQAVEVKQRENYVRQQSEQWVNNHPRVQECFTADPLGRKIWNNAHPLTQLIGGYMREADLSKRPDALAIATKLALADYMDAQNTTNQKQVKTLKQTLKKTQKATLIEGGTSQQDVVKSKSKYNKAMEVFRATGSKESLQDVLKAKLGIEE